VSAPHTQISSSRSRLIEAKLEALFQVGQVLSRSLRLEETLQGVLQVLHDKAGMLHGMVTLRGQQQGELAITAVYSGGKPLRDKVTYRSGEGIIDSVLEDCKTIVLPRIAGDARFLDRLGLYDLNLPFIGIPIQINGDEVVGVLAAQPCSSEDALLPDRTRFMEMVAQLVAQTVRLAREIEKERRDLTDERDRLRRAVRGNYGFDNVIGHSSAMKRVFDTVRQVAKWNTTVLIRGESGTGKELIANAIHYNSPRSQGEFVKVNCAALPENLLESELFGHEKGAFSGAISQHKGRFERADGGTLFLDEIGETTTTFQAKLLRVLQEGELERGGEIARLKWMYALLQQPMLI